MCYSTNTPVGKQVTGFQEFAINFKCFLWQ